MTTMIVAPACLLQCPQCLVNVDTAVSDSAGT